jgi:hypothetical protein
MTLSPVSGHRTSFFVSRHMQLKLNNNTFWLRKVAVYLAFFGLLSVKNAEGYGLPPLISVPPVGVSVQNGGTISLTATIGVSLTPLTVRWYCNGNELKNATVQNLSVPIVGTTISTLTIPNASLSQAGTYYVKVENGGGEVTSGNAIVVVVGGPNLVSANLLPSQCRMTNGGFQLQMLKPASSNCVVEASTDFINWTPIYTNSSGSTNISYLDSAATNLPQRYYRARLQ